jgi:hypothetical protein
MDNRCTIQAPLYNNGNFFLSMLLVRGRRSYCHQSTVRYFVQVVSCMGD